ncbi:hypothetical protein NP493_1054g00080 [Ridgeia piscesae]|uniref:TRPM-like domain-containing protein n=1 Tax=Ridgeia piscesae TaxID=27915 RepID=A0AAD9KI44_RIDPI|nr:hypothetical protein NP493_1054g00080 [Ridgeia piscesae]
MSTPDQLSLTLAWNRVDIAKKHIFVYGQEWPERALEQAMTDALANDRVDFIQPLLENGVSMHKWLTIMRLEELYNVGLKVMPTSARGTQNQDGASTLRYLIRENKKHIPSGYHYTLFDIGLVMEKLMGGAYRAEYCRKKFRIKYNAVMQKVGSPGNTVGNLLFELPVPVLKEVYSSNEIFQYPFHHLLLWAVLIRRQKMAKCMWQHGEEALAKALIACRLYKSMAREAADDALEVDISEELQGFAREFSSLALDLLEHCHKTDDDLTQQLLTYELRSWSEQTCLALANCANHRDFIAYTSCQILLTEMWMGGLRTRKYASLKVILGILLLFPCLWMEFRSKEELQLMPQTMEEHIQEVGSDSDTASVTSDNSHRTHQALAFNHLVKSQLLTDEQVSLSVDKKGAGLTYSRKLYEFYTAPITKFWLHTVGRTCTLDIDLFSLTCSMYNTINTHLCTSDNGKKHSVYNPVLTV